MWLRKAQAACSRWRSDAREDHFEGWHDGYLALEDPVLHRRAITLDKAARRIAIEDTLQMEGSHTVELFFHAHEECEVVLDPRGATLRRGDRALRIEWPDLPGEASVLRGSVEPIGGWVSRAFDRKVPAPTLVWRARLAGRSTLTTRIECR